MSSTDSASPMAAQQQARRKKALRAIAIAVVLGSVAYGAYYGLVASHYEHTDNAYVQANVVQVTPQVGGTVVANGDQFHVFRGDTVHVLERHDALRHAGDDEQGEVKLEGAQVADSGGLGQRLGRCGFGGRRDRLFGLQLRQGRLGRETQSSRQNETALQKMARVSFPET